VQFRQKLQKSRTQKSKFEHIELRAKLLDYFLQSNKLLTQRRGGEQLCQEEYLLAPDHAKENSATRTYTKIAIKSRDSDGFDAN